MRPFDCVACNQVALTIKRLRSILLKGVDAEPISLLDTICGLLDIPVCHPGGNPVANIKSISHRCHPILVAFVWELTEETIDLHMGCLQGGMRSLIRVLGPHQTRPQHSAPDQHRQHFETCLV